MEIDETINKWLTLSDNKLTTIGNHIYNKSGSSDEQKYIYQYCLLIKHMVSDYSKSVVLLCNRGKKLPARVILRTLAELVVKFSWCIKEAHEDISAFYANCERWNESSLIQQRKFLKRAFECFGDSQIKQNLEKCQNGIDRINNVDKMPNNAELCKELFGNKEGGLNYLILFGQLNEAVHSDLFLLRRLRVSGIDDEISDSILNEVIVSKKMCMACIYLLLKYIYQYYEVDFSSIEFEYSRLKD